jgi:hypothetical protein
MGRVRSLAVAVAWLVRHEAMRLAFLGV